MEKSKIIIVSHALEIGGAERALLSLLESFDYNQYEVDLFLMRHEGELLSLLPKEVNLLPSIKEYTCLAVPFASILKKGMFHIATGRLLAKIKTNLYVKKNKITGDNAVELEYSHKYTKVFMPQISEKEYDLAISFLTPHYFASEKIKSKKKIAWIHTDYSLVNIDINSEYKMWNQYDYIASISNDCTKGFLLRFPTLEKKIVLIENIVSSIFINKQANIENHSLEFTKRKCIKVLSIGRFSYQKNFDNVPYICKQILNSGIDIEWYLIGFGPEEDLIRKKIEEEGVQNNVIILGKKTNPYPYIKQCDVYIQPSRYEGKCIAVREAQVLRKPVIITDYPTASSQLIDKVDGFIVPLNNDDCAIQITNILNDRENLLRIVNNMELIDYSSKEEINKIYSLLKGKL